MLAMAEAIEIEAALAGLGGLRREGGNTQSPSKTHTTKQEPKRKQHFFTVNNHTEEFLGGILQYFNEHSLKYRIQEETGENGTPHLQGCVQFNKEIRSSCWDKQSKGHYEKLKGSWEDAVEYCSKLETRTGREWSKGLPKPLKLITPKYWWQLEIIEIMKNEPNDRKVYWYWSERGDLGKSQFAKYLVSRGDCVFIDEGEKKDAMFLVMAADMDIKTSVIYDMPRAQGNRICYKSIESIKNGMIFSPKYESGYKLFNSPHLIVFANAPPQHNKLSNDRWVITQIDDPNGKHPFDE